MTNLTHDDASRVGGMGLHRLLDRSGLGGGGPLTHEARVHGLRVIDEPARIELVDAAGEVVASIAREGDDAEESDISLVPDADLGAIALRLHSELLEHLREVTNRSLRVLRSLTQAELAGANLQDIVEILAELVKNPVIVKTPTHEVLAWSGDPAAHDEARKSTIDSGSVTPEVLKALDEYGVLERLRFDQRPIRVEPDESVGLGPRVVCSIHAGGVNLGYVSISEGIRGLDRLDLLAVENAASVVGLHLAHMRALDEAILTRRALLVSELLFQQPQNTHRTRQISKLLGVDLDRPYAVVAIPTWTSPDRESAPHETQAIVATLNVLLSREDLEGIATIEGDTLIALLPQDRMDPNDRMNDVLLELMAHHPNRSMAMGISRARMPSQSLQDGYDEAHLAARIGRDIRGSGSVTTYEALGALNILGQLGPDAVDRYIESVLGKDEKFRKEFRETFTALADAGYNKAAAARTLGLHVNTVQYRLKKIGQVTGFDPDSGNGRFTLECALRLVELLVARQQRP